MNTLEKIEAIKTARLLLAGTEAFSTYLLEALHEIERDLWIEEVGNVLTRKHENTFKQPGGTV